MKSAVSLLAIFLAATASAQERHIVRPQEIDEVLVNPGIGFTTFQEFEGDRSWKRAAGQDHPKSSIAYFRLYWSELEPEQGKYRWEIVDRLLQSAHEHDQTLMLRLSPYSYTRRQSASRPGAGGRRQRNVPKWYRELVGNDFDRLAIEKWSTDPEDPFGNLIREFGKRYDGHPDLESVDLAIVGAWGEGAGAVKLSGPTRRALVDCYIESVKKTPLVALLMDSATNRYAMSKAAVGWRADCLGDMGGFEPHWSHMLDRYPQAIVENGLSDAWKSAPVNFEVCWVMQKWKDEGWDINYIVDQSLKWHLSSFNGKSAAVPLEWRPVVDRWLKSMGYRFVLRKFAYPETVRPRSRLRFSSWWENKGVAPCYRQFPSP